MSTMNIFSNIVNEIIGFESIDESPSYENDNIEEEIMTLDEQYSVENMELLSKDALVIGSSVGALVIEGIIKKEQTLKPDVDPEKLADLFGFASMESIHELAYEQVDETGEAGLSTEEPETKGKGSVSKPKVIGKMIWKILTWPFRKAAKFIQFIYRKLTGKGIEKEVIDGKVTPEEIANTVQVATDAGNDAKIATKLIESAKTRFNKDVEALKNYAGKVAEAAKKGGAEIKGFFVGTPEMKAAKEEQARLAKESADNAAKLQSRLTEVIEGIKKEMSGDGAGTITDTAAAKQLKKLLDEVRDNLKDASKEVQEWVQKMDEVQKILTSPESKKNMTSDDMNAVSQLFKKLLEEFPVNGNGKKEKTGFFRGWFSKSKGKEPSKSLTDTPSTASKEEDILSLLKTMDVSFESETDHYVYDEADDIEDDAVACAYLDMRYVAESQECMDAEQEFIAGVVTFDAEVAMENAGIGFEEYITVGNESISEKILGEEISMEGVGESIKNTGKKAWNTVKGLIEKLINFITTKFRAWFTKLGRIERIVKALGKKIESLKDSVVNTNKVDRPEEEQEKRSGIVLEIYNSLDPVGLWFGKLDGIISRVLRLVDEPSSTLDENASKAGDIQMDMGELLTKSQEKGFSDAPITIPEDTDAYLAYRSARLIYKDLTEFIDTTKYAKKSIDKTTASLKKKNNNNTFTEEDAKTFKKYVVGVVNVANKLTIVATNVLKNAVKGLTQLVKISTGKETTKTAEAN